MPKLFARKASVERTGKRFCRRGRCLHRPNPPQAGLFDESAQAARARLPPAGNFSPQKSSQNAPGAAAPGPPLGPAACIPRKGISQAAALHLAVPSHTAYPFPASRGPVESAGRYGYSTFLKGRTDCSEDRGLILHAVALQPLSHGFAVTAPLTQGSLGGCKPAVLRTISPFSP